MYSNSQYITSTCLITGLYNLKFNEEYPANVPIVCERPIIDYANKLYMISKQGQAIQSNFGDEEYTPSVIASIIMLLEKIYLLCRTSKQNLLHLKLTPLERISIL